MIELLVALAKIDPVDREMLIDHSLLEKSFEALAVEHGCSRQRAYNRVRRARQQLALALRPERVPHGTMGGYANYSCRCAECVEAQRVYAQQRKAAA